MVDDLKCSQCNRNPSGSKYCNACGKQLIARCIECNHTNPPESIYCNKCGSKMDYFVGRAGSLELVDAQEKADQEMLEKLFEAPEDKQEKADQEMLEKLFEAPEDKQVDPDGRLARTPVLKDTEMTRESFLTLPFRSDHDKPFNIIAASTVGFMVLTISGEMGIYNISMAVYHAAGEFASLVTAGLMSAFIVCVPAGLLHKYVKQQSFFGYTAIFIILFIVYATALVGDNALGAIFTVILLFFIAQSL